MGYPKKFKQLLESTLNDVERPDYVWLTYAVCAMTADACGWDGWTIEGAFKQTDKLYPTATGDKALTSDNENQRCPRCGRQLFRTQATIRLTPSGNQISTTGVPVIDYEVVPMRYDDGE